MQEKRGSQWLKLIDRYAGGILLAILTGLLRIKTKPSGTQSKEPQVCLLICIGAIGDLILLTEAARLQLKDKSVVLACSNANLACARMYQNFYANILPIDIRSVLDIHRICQQHKINVIYDSTQWANIGPLQVGLARLFGNGLVAIGFKTLSAVRNDAYTLVVPHSAGVHEVLNFMNLLAGREMHQSNNVLPGVLSQQYQQHQYRRTQKVLFHMWPSGTRAYLKEWPESYWIDLAHDFYKRGYQIYLSGAPADKDRNRAFMAKAGLNNLHNIAGSYDLTALSAFIANEIECAISVNTGILHLVASLGVPIIGLHGPTNPMRWGPLGVNAVALLPETGNFAYLHYGHEYPETDAAAYALNRLTVQQVVKAFENLSRQES